MAESVSPYSHNKFGQTGLIHIPTARMQHDGTLSAGLTVSDPYSHGFLGFQLDRRLSVNLRQTIQTDDILDGANDLQPGLDLKFLLLEEDHYTPALAIGMISAIGAREQASEYLVASKRWNNLDFTLGIGWGRLGQAAHFSNPLGNLSDHFDQARNISSFDSNQSADWFTGEDIGLFGGVEYFLPIDGLSLKAEYNSDLYNNETQSNLITAGNRLNIGVNYRPTDGINIGLGLEGGKRLMARFSANSFIGDFGQGNDFENAAMPLPLERIHTADISRAPLSAARDGIRMFGLKTDHSHGASAYMERRPYKNFATEIGRTARHIAKYAPADIEALTIHTRYLGLKGPTVTLNRSDLENADQHRGSPQEIWNNADIAAPTPSILDDPKFDFKLMNSFTFGYTLENRVSLAEEDIGMLYRSSLLAESRNYLGYGLMFGTGLRLALLNNTERLSEFRFPRPKPVRSDIDLYSTQGVGVEKFHLTWMRTPLPNIHTRLSAGWFEEMYGGFGGEILYRPFNSRLAFGLEFNRAYKRLPGTAMDFEEGRDGVNTGHASLYYDIPDHDLTVIARAGRYLAEDYGVTTELIHHFDNGATLSGHITMSDQSDTSLLGGNTHFDHGMRLSFPIGRTHSYIPDDTKITLDTRPFGRDIGQRLEGPIKLYQATEGLSYRRLIQEWPKIMD